MGAERSTLHNFTMPSELRWVNQKHLRCMNVNSGGRISPLRRHDPCTSDQRSRHNSFNRRRADIGGREGGSCSELAHGSHDSGGGRRYGDVDDGIAATREKLTLDLQTEAGRMRDAIFRDGIEVSGSPPPPPAAEGEIHMLPWNMRTRRTACRTPVSRFVSGNAAGDGGMKPDPRAAGSDKSVRLRRGGGAAAVGEKRERASFAVALSKAEIDEDFFGMMGHMSARRPKKRNRNVQRQLDVLFPGLWLKEVAPHMYKVSEATP